MRNQSRQAIRVVRWAAALLAMFAAALAGCRLGPDYRSPDAPMASAYTRVDGPDFLGRPAGSDWWTVFHDPELDSFELQADTANRDIKVAVARLDEVGALLRSARSYLFPTISAQPQVSRTREARDRPNNGNTGGKAATYNDFQVPLVVNYEIDVWSRIRRSLEAARATEQASEADVRFVRLATESAVAIDYYQLRQSDQEIAVIQGSIEDLQQALKLTQLRFEHGLSSDLEVAQAQTQLDQTTASEQSVKSAREQSLHALAVLIGRTPESLVLPARPDNREPPVIPVGLPSDLLKRRPDIAEADRNVAVATAQIGVAKAAYFPSLSLTGLAGYESSNPATLITWQNTITSLGASVIAPIFTGGRLRAGVDQARATYRESLAAYEKAVLVSYQEVEDQLSALHFLAIQAQLQNLAVQDATRAEHIAIDRYTHGLVGYLDVVVSQQNVLFNERTATQIAGQRLVASVVLIKALGGGWEQVDNAKTR